MKITTLLTLSTLFGSLSIIVPPVSYLTKLDIYLITCMVHVFFALVEYPIALTLQRFGFMRWVWRIEMFAKIIFPCSFIIFNLYYCISLEKI